MSASPSFPPLKEGWHEETGFLPQKTDRNKIFYRLLRRKQGVPLGRVLYIVHGIGEQSDRFIHYPHYLHTAIDAVAMIDLPGHGKSSGPRGHIENFDGFSEPLIDGFNFLYSQLVKSFGPTEIHWMGCSMGGLITTKTMLKWTQLPLASVILAEPQFGIAIKVPWWKEFFGTALEPVIGRVPLKNEIDVRQLSHDEEVQETYRSNPLNHPFVSPRLYVNMKKEMSEMLTTNLEFPYALFVLVPLADEIVSWKATYRFFEHLKMKAGKTKQMTSFPGWYHECFNEREKGRAFLALENWVVKATSVRESYSSMVT